MKEQFNHKLITSFYLWFDNLLLKKGEGFVNKSGRLERQTDASSSLLYSWASPHQHWVWDSDATGASLVTSVTTSSGDVLTRASGVKFDHINGRVLSNTNWGSYLTASYARKEFNIYTAEEDEVDLYLESIKDSNKDLSAPQTGINPYQFVAPCVILTSTNNYNDPFALGGEDITHSSMRAFVITNNKFNKEAIESLSRDSARASFPLVPTEAMPLNEYGDLKTGSYSYTELAQTHSDAKKIYIAGVDTIKVGEKVNNNSNYSLSLIDFDLEIIRVPANEI